MLGDKFPVVSTTGFNFAESELLTSDLTRQTGLQVISEGHFPIVILAGLDYTEKELLAQHLQQQTELHEIWIYPIYCNYIETIKADDPTLEKIDWPEYVGDPGLVEYMAGEIAKQVSDLRNEGRKGAVFYSGYGPLLIEILKANLQDVRVIVLVIDSPKKARIDRLLIQWEAYFSTDPSWRTQAIEGIEKSDSLLAQAGLSQVIENANLRFENDQELGSFQKVIDRIKQYLTEIKVID